MRPSLNFTHSQTIDFIEYFSNKKLACSLQ